MPSAATRGKATEVEETATAAGVSLPAEGVVARASYPTRARAASRSPACAEPRGHLAGPWTGPTCTPFFARHGPSGAQP